MFDSEVNSPELGLAVGYPISLALYNIYTENFEQKALTMFESSSKVLSVMYMQLITPANAKHLGHE